MPCIILGLFLHGQVSAHGLLNLIKSHLKNLIKSYPPKERARIKILGMTGSTGGQPIVPNHFIIPEEKLPNKIARMVLKN
jgi:hypothetical protein